ncbi:MAG: hypothetical protein NTZ49_00485, partial [Candidatus Parcubacteria bacterium]|nr:hypothetical protein [Candidatus Parcubacteria bacterium]
RKMILANSKQNLYTLINNELAWENWKNNGVLSELSAKDRENLYLDINYLLANNRFNQIFSKIIVNSSLSTSDFWLILQ